MAQPAEPLSARAQVALARKRWHRARDLADLGLNARPAANEAERLLVVRAWAELGLGRVRAARLTAERALGVADGSAAAHGALGAAAACEREWPEAASSYACAAALEPQRAEWHAGSASALLELSLVPQAEAHARRALELDGTQADALLVLGRSALRKGEPAEAVCLLRQAAQREPERADVRVTLGVALAASGDYGSGFAEYEWRQQLSGWNARAFDLPPWRGQALGGPRLLLWSEQGLGDSLQFARFAARARAAGAHVVFHGEPRLVRLFRSCNGFDEVHSSFAQRPPAAFHASLVSLPSLLGLASAEVGMTEPYLAPEAALTKAWRERLGPKQRALRVGLVWQGNPAFCDDSERSLALAHWLPLLRAHATQIEFLSLQKGFGQDQLHLLPSDVHVRDLGSQLDTGGDAFVDSAAVLGELDLLLTSDTALAHLAGALNRPVWTLLARVPDWRWGVSDATTPWYPSMRLFRQPQAGDWPAVVNAVSAALAVHQACANG